MNIYQTIQKRYSVRAYQDKAVPQQSLQRILEAARLAPSTHNSQPWKFIIVQNQEKRKELAQAARQSFIVQAPVIIAAIALEPERVMSCEVPAYAVDLAIAVDHMTLAAVEEGLGSCWIGAFAQSEVKKILQVPAEYKVVVLLSLGFPADEPGLKRRKKLEEIVCWESYT